MSNVMIGDTCDDGSKFLGFHPDFGWQGFFYVTDVNQSNGQDWSTAISTCNNLSRHGKDDWYLPSISELEHLYEHHTAIGGFTTDVYWSSTEAGSSNAWYAGFSSGGANSGTKSNSLDVRCVRKG